MEEISVSLTGSTMYSDYSRNDNGYSTASHNLYNYLYEAGIKMSRLSQEADINISFAVPQHHILLANSYNILYSAHETTEICDRWVKCLDKGDEVWATSSWIADVYRAKVKNPVHVVPHGVSGKFIPVKRKLQDNKFIFLHIGEPYIRKGGQVTVEAFIEEFGDNPDVILLIKCYPEGHTIRVPDKDGNLVAPETIYPNIKTMSQSLSFSDYLKVLHNTHCLVYPSWGEGFGMMPLECMASGMPVISSWEWAEYKDDIKHKIESDLVPVPERIPSYLVESYLGEIYMPRKESIRKLMREVYENYEQEFKESAVKAVAIHKKWNWEDIMEKYAIPRLKKIKEKLNEGI
jgi:glycosyltransferase involved in cell wall biosynthesis